MAVTFGGLATGLDTNALIDGLMAVESLPLVRNVKEQDEITSAISTFTSFIGTVNAVKTEAEKLDTDSEFASLSSESTNDDKVLATATGSALPGSYTVHVEALALETRTKSDAFADSTSPLGETGNFDINVGGFPTVNIVVAAGDSLADIAANINASDARVSASIIYDGASSSRLLVRGIDTGVVNDVTYTETGTDLGLDTTANPTNTYQNAQDAEITIDGEFTVTRGTNNFADVLPGVTLTVKEVHTLSTDTETITIATDPVAQEAKIQSFVDAYNKMLSAGHLASGFAGVDAVNPQLAGDSAIRSALDRMGVTISSAIAGLTGKYNMLAAVGVSLESNGNLKIDSTKLTDALNADAEAVAKVFAGDEANSIDGMMKLIIDTVDTLTDGSTSLLESRKGAFEDQVERLESEEIVLERRLGEYEDRLRKKFTQMELLVSQIQQQGNGLSGLVGFQTVQSNNNK